MTIDTRLAEIRARAENAASFRDERGVPTLTGFSIPDLSNVIRADLPALLAAVEAVRELADRLEWEADPANHLGSDLDYCRIATAQRIRTALTAALEVEG